MFAEPRDRPDRDEEHVLNPFRIVAGGTRARDAAVAPTVVTGAKRRAPRCGASLVSSLQPLQRIPNALARPQDESTGALRIETLSRVR